MNVEEITGDQWQNPGAWWRRKMKQLIRLLRLITGFHNVYNGTTCDISEHLEPCHDYQVHKGGDGEPTHFHIYTCWKCGKDFII